MKGRFIDLTGMRFGRLVVLRRIPDTLPIYWWCRCDCGIEKAIRGTHLTTKNVQSCGCYRLERCKSVALETGLAAKKSIYRTYIDSAKKRKMSFELSFEQFIELTQQNCHYCDSKPENVRDYIRKNNRSMYNGNFIYNGIDRIDNTKGYTKENSITCCKRCNFAKRNMSYDEFIEWGKKLGNNLGVKEGNKMELEKEIELLREKLSLLEKIKKMQDEIRSKEVPHIPYAPIYPQPYIVPTIIFDPINPMPIIPMLINPVEDPWYWSPNTTNICSN